MRILILTPAAFPSLTGNAITTERWRRALTERNIAVEVVSADGLDSHSFVEQLHRFHPDLIHVYHVFKSGAVLLNDHTSHAWNSLPLVVSPGGTDLNLDLGDPQREKKILRILEMASLIVSQSADMVQSLVQQHPELGKKIITISKATCWFGDEPYNLRNITGCAPEDVLFFLPAGIRPVKGNLECLLAMEQVHAMRRNARFTAAGPALDAVYAARFEREVKRLNGFARWIPFILPAAMRSAYESSDVVLNASLSEGLSNSLLEAVAAGRPVLASDIPGNRQIVFSEPEDTQAGLLFNPRDAHEFVRKAIALIDDGGLRKKLGASALIRQSTLPNQNDEASGLIAAYRSVLRKID